MAASPSEGAGGKRQCRVWDVVDMEVGDALQACDEGPAGAAGPGELSAGDDGTRRPTTSIPTRSNECWATTIIFSTVFAYDDSKIGPNKPNTIGDFFDLQKFPGKRGLRKQNPKATLEMALIADGVAPEDVYEVLATPEGLDRAFAKLDTIRTASCGGKRARSVQPLLADGEVAMTVVYNGRLFDAVAAEGKPFKIVWDAQVMEYDTYVVVKGAPHKDVAMDFMRFATATKQLAAQASWIAYAPARKSSLALVGRTPPTADMLPNLPTPDKGRAVTVDPRSGPTTRMRSTSAGRPGWRISGGGLSGTRTTAMANDDKPPWARANRQALARAAARRLRRGVLRRAHRRDAVAERFQSRPFSLMPRTAAALADWDGGALPGEAAFAAVAEDLKTLPWQAGCGAAGRAAQFRPWRAQLADPQDGARGGKLTPPYAGARLNKLDRKWGEQGCVGGARSRHAAADRWRTISRRSTCVTAPISGRRGAREGAAPI